MEVQRNTACLESTQEDLICCLKVIDKQITLAKVSLYQRIERDGEVTVIFGHFQCVNDHSVFQLLFDEVVAECRRINATLLVGPMNGSTWNEYRVTTSGFGQTFLLDVANPDYHIELYESYGMNKWMEYSSTKADELLDHWEHVEKSYNEFRDMGVEFQDFDLAKPEIEFSMLHPLIQQSFSNNPLFTPLTKEKFLEKMALLLPLIDSRYTIVAKHGGKTVGFIFCYHDVLNTIDKTIVVKTLARSPETAYQGMGSVLSSLAMKRAMADGFTKGIHALMVNSNTSTYISNKFKAHVFKQYALMRLKIK